MYFATIENNLKNELVRCIIGGPVTKSDTTLIFQVEGIVIEQVTHRMAAPGW